jgi:hypothetical protein
MHPRRTVAVIVSFASMLGGCLDASPVTIGTQDAGLVIEASIPGDSPLAIDAYAHPECRACIAADPALGPGCGDKLDACTNDSKYCVAIYECAYSLGCVTKPTQNESISCAIPCATALMITDVNDPSIQLAIRLTECFHGPCASKCEIKEGAVPASAAK